MPNLVQAEFFHVGRNGSSLDEVLDECYHRIGEGLELALKGVEPRFGIKTVVRFFDYAGDLTAIAQEAEKLEARSRENHADLMSASGLQRWWLGSQSRRIAGAAINLDKKAHRLAAVRLLEAIRGSKEVAIEMFDHRFRPLRADEAHEVAEAIATSTRIWLFIFKPNAILSDSNEPVAHLM